MDLPGPIRLAMKFALLYSATFLAGSMITGGIHARYYGQPFWVVIILYLVGGLFVGCCVDLVRQHLRTRWLAAIAGFFIAAPLALATNLLFLPRVSMFVLYLSTTISALIYGVGYGLILWVPPEPPRKTQAW